MVVPVLRTSWLSASGTLSTKKIAGPATVGTVARATTSFGMGVASLVIQRATGPLVPAGTLHCASGKLTDALAPPTMMLQKRF